MAEVAGPMVRSTSHVLSDDGSGSSRRSSSLASHTSSESTKDKTVRRPKRQRSKQPISKTHTRDPSLTSFPSFSQDVDDGAPTTPVHAQAPTRTDSQRLKERKATLAGLTSASPFAGARQHALFDDSPRSSIDIPGSLHLANDDHIERLVARKGAVKLIRQYASDLAQRDAEISTLRVRADLRERELKKMLRDANIPSAEIEKRLMKVEKPDLSTSTVDNFDSRQKRKSTTSLDGMMNEAMSDGMTLASADGVQEISASALLAEPRKQSLAQSTLRRLNSAASAEVAREERASSQETSRANSIASQNSDHEATVRPRNPSSTAGRLTGLQSIFQPPNNSTSYFIGGSIKTIKKAKASDELSVRSNTSAKSGSSWMRIFGGSSTTRSRASSVEQSSSAIDDVSAAASLSQNRSVSTTVPRTKPHAGSVKGRPPPIRNNTGGRSATSPHHVRKESNASNLPPTVELDSMIESSQLPPTMTSYNPEGLLTDPFGFIYDRNRKRHQLLANQDRKHKAGSTGAGSTTRTEAVAQSDKTKRPTTPLSVDEDSAKKSWQDYLMPMSGANKGRPRELLSHTPSAGAIVTVSSSDAYGAITPPRVRESSISVSAQKALPTMSSITEPQSSVVTVTSSGFAQEQDSDASDLAAAKLLLDQLTDVHDSLQAERTVKWNDFLRRVRAERANSSDRDIKNAPEADLVDGELIGIATLGRSSKTKSKYLHFKTLVLAGIPVSLRPKIWAECSGATQLRIPGYYEDLVTRSHEGSGVDQDSANQITADVRRTLRDNIFFRDPDGPGAQRLEELLRAYSLHNPKIGYCQGMNLITASLLLICATPEDCFWLLVAIIDHILPSGYFDPSLITARADQVVLRHYVTEVLPKLDNKLHELGVELEACTFHWFLSLYSGVLTGGEALYRVWDVVLCLNSSDAVPQHRNPQARNLNIDMTALGLNSPTSPNAPNFPSAVKSNVDEAATPLAQDATHGALEHDGTSSPFLFQLSLALLKLNEAAILTLDSPATVYTYLNHNMTAHNITIDALVAAAEGLRTRVKRQDVLERRKAALATLI